MNAELLIKGHEGYVEGIYLDSRGYPTCGYGNCLDSSRAYKTIKEWHECCFAGHMEKAERDYETLGLDLDEIRKAAVLDLLFNLGLTKFKKFAQTLAALRSKDYERAAEQLKHSRWYNQVGVRGPRICSIIRDGRW